MGSRRHIRVSIALSFSMIRGRDPRFQEFIVSEELSRRKFVMSGAAIVAAGAGMTQSQADPTVPARVG